MTRSSRVADDELHAKLKAAHHHVQALEVRSKMCSDAIAMLIFSQCTPPRKEFGGSGRY